MAGRSFSGLGLCLWLPGGGSIGPAGDALVCGLADLVDPAGAAHQFGQCVPLSEQDPGGQNPEQFLRVYLLCIVFSGNPVGLFPDRVSGRFDKTCACMEMTRKEG